MQGLVYHLLSNVVIIKPLDKTIHKCRSLLLTGYYVINGGKIKDKWPKSFTSSQQFFLGQIFQEFSLASVSLQFYLGHFSRQMKPGTKQELELQETISMRWNLYNCKQNIVKVFKMP